MDKDSAYTVAASKVPMLKPDVIENDNAPLITQVVEGVETIIAPATAEKRHKEDVKSLLQAIEQRLGGNAATKKTQRNFLKQQYKNFTASSSEDLQQIHPHDLEKMDLRWQVAMLTMRARRFLKNTGRKFSLNGNDTIGFDKSKVECYNCHKRGHFAMECRAPRSQDTKHKESTRRIVPMETPALAALVSCDGFGGYDWSDQTEDGPTNFSLIAYSCTSSNYEVSTDLNYSSSCLENVKILKEQNEQLLKDLRTSKINAITYKIEEFVNEPILSEPIVKKPVVETSEPKASADKLKDVRKNFGPLLIKDWISDSEDEAESKSKIEKETVKPSFANINFVKSKEQIMKKLMKDMLPLEVTLKEGKSQREVDKDPRQESKCKDPEKGDNVNSTNNVNAAETNRVNTVGANTNNELPFDLEMPALEDISTFNFSSDHEDDVEEADMNNMDTTI
nr:hypothetical protein [Tanacetum cinerariifolium]